MTPRQLLTLPTALLTLASAGVVEGIRFRLETAGSDLPLLASAFPVSTESIPTIELPTLLVAASVIVDEPVATPEPAPAPGSLRLNKPLLPKSLAEDVYQPLVGGRTELASIRQVRVPSGLRRTALSESRLVSTLQSAVPDSIIRPLTGS